MFFICLMSMSTLLSTIMIFEDKRQFCMFYIIIDKDILSESYQKEEKTNNLFRTSELVSSKII